MPSWVTNHWVVKSNNSPALVKGIQNAVTAIDNTDSPYTPLLSDYTIVCDATGGAITVDLPAAAGTMFDGKILNIKKTDSSGNAVTIDGNAAETLDGSTTKVISVQYDSIMIQSDGSNWHII